MSGRIAPLALDALETTRGLASPRAGGSEKEAWLSWRGRRWQPGEGGAASAEGCIVPVEWAEGAEREEGARGRGASKARLIQGDALEIAENLAREGLAGRVDLVYLDPPFASQAAYTHEARLDGPADGRVVRARAYDDRWEGGIGDYLEMLAPRLEALTRLLCPQGTIWVHVDWRASYLVRLLLDEIVGRDGFKNEIVWRRAPNLGRQAASHQFGRTLDTILVYGGPEARLVPPTRLEPIPARSVRWDEQGRPFTGAPRGDYTDESIRRLDAEGRVHRTASGKVYIKYFLVEHEGAWCRERRVDALWTDVPPLRHAAPSERTGFPTQKPRALLDRIIGCASPSGGLVVDLFAGSGTTGESAHALGRRFILGDQSALAIGTARARLLRAGAPLCVERTAGRMPVGVPDAQEARGGVRVRVQRDGSRAQVELCEPREPLAWAIDVAPRPGEPFCTAWHSERAPAARAARPVLSRADVEAEGAIAVRVWFDDGRVATHVAEGG